MLTTIWRRHASGCAHKAKGRTYIKCNCPLWSDGYKDGKRVFRQSLKTRDLARASKRAAALEAEDPRKLKTVRDAIRTFLDHCASEGLKESSRRKYANALHHLESFCQTRGLDQVRELDLHMLDAYRAQRQLAPLTAYKELELLRQFCSYCVDRRWMEENAAKRIRSPRNLRPKEVVPYTPAEVAKILTASLAIGRTPYERVRVHAMIVSLRYTGLRIGDVIMLRRDRISLEGDRWRIFLRTEKSGKLIYLTIPTEMKAALDKLPVPRGADPDCPYYFWSGKSSEKSVKATADRALRAAFKKSEVQGAHAHRFRHTLATELLGSGGTFEEVADILGNTPAIVRKHYAKWSQARQSRIDELMARVHAGASFTRPTTLLQ